jgi:ADP-dependent NAD(P)H-hydrate dehydratase / NAD(P)H-hydrate epimerase
MMDHTYWQKQNPTKPLFPDIVWAKPEQRSHAGRLVIIGGNKLGFAAVAGSYKEALELGAGECRVVMPDALRRSIPSNITDTVFVPTNQSGGMSKEGEAQMIAAAHWANGVLLIGDAGRNSETAILFESLLQKYQGPVTVTRDAVDLLKGNMQPILERGNTLLVVSFAQLQKMFQAVYYPKALLFNMQLNSLVEALHKFTVTYPATIMVLHSENIVIANNGEVVSTPWLEPLAIWRGSVAAKAATFWLWTPDKPLEAAAASLTT